MTDTLDPLVQCRAPGWPGVYVLGCFEKAVSIYLQQVRALNLVWTLNHAGTVGPGARIAVVGGGFAGLTFAVAAARLGASVWLYERQPTLLTYQRDNHTRHLHPHIHEWPREGAQRDEAG